VNFLCVCAYHHHNEKQPPRSLQWVPHEMHQPEDHQFQRPAQGLYGVGHHDVDDVHHDVDGRGNGHYDSGSDGHHHNCLHC